MRNKFESARNVETDGLLTLAGTDVNEPFPSLYCCRDWSLVQLKGLAGFLVKDLLDSEEKSWMQISQEHAVDPAAQLVAKDFS